MSTSAMVLLKSICAAGVLDASLEFTFVSVPVAIQPLLGGATNAHRVHRVSDATDRTNDIFLAINPATDQLIRVGSGRVAMVIAAQQDAPTAVANFAALVRAGQA